MEDRQFKGYQELRSKLLGVMERYEWSEKDLTDGLRMLEEDGEQFLEE